jgi:hypothetical protein
MIWRTSTTNAWHVSILMSVPLLLKLTEDYGQSTYFHFNLNLILIGPNLLLSLSSRTIPYSAGGNNSITIDDCLVTGSGAGRAILYSGCSKYSILYSELNSNTSSWLTVATKLKTCKAIPRRIWELMIISNGVCYIFHHTAKLAFFVPDLDDIHKLLELL